MTDAARAPAAAAGRDAPLVFVHGLKGARLRRGGEVIWATLGHALGCKRPDLRLPTRWEGDRQVEDGAQPLPFHRVTCCCCTVSQVYGPLCAELGRRRPGRFTAFAYDWRRDLHESAALLEACLRGEARIHGRAVQVVCHSMGGMIVLAVLNRAPELFHSVLFCAASFGPGISFLEDVSSDVADPAPAGRLLGPRVWFTCPSLWTFFPDGRGGEGTYRGPGSEPGGARSDAGEPWLVDEGGAPIHFDFYSVDSWERHRLGPYAAGELPAGERAFFAGVLARARRFRRLLRREEGVRYPPLTCLVALGAGGEGVVDCGAIRGKGGRWAFGTHRARGDGRLAAPKQDCEQWLGIPARRVDAHKSHSEVVSHNTRQIVDLLDELCDRATAHPLRTSVSPPRPRAL